MAEEQWWSRRWFTALREMGYDVDTSTRGSRVQQLEVARGRITAQVQDRELGVCSVEVRLLPLGNSDWSNVVDALCEHALYVAQLLAGDIPIEIEQAFGQAGLTLLPASRHELQSSTSCSNEIASASSALDEPNGDPDDSNGAAIGNRPLLAVYHALGEMFDDDPWLLFQLRGRDKQQLATALQDRRRHVEVGPTASAHAATASPPVSAFFPTERPEPLAHDAASSLLDALDTFWGAPRLLNNLQHQITPPSVDVALLRRLGPPPFTTAEGQVYDELMAVYHHVSHGVLALAYATDDD